MRSIDVLRKLLELFDPQLNTLIKSDDIIIANGSSESQNIRGAKHVDVLISVGNPTGTTPTIQFFLDILEETSGETVRTYNGALLSAAGKDYITVDGLTLGQYVKVRWVVGGGDPSWPDVYTRLVAKR